MYRERSGFYAMKRDCNEYSHNAIASPRPSRPHFDPLDTPEQALIHEFFPRSLSVRLVKPIHLRIGDKWSWRESRRDQKIEVKLSDDDGSS